MISGTCRIALRNFSGGVVKWIPGTPSFVRRSKSLSEGPQSSGEYNAQTIRAMQSFLGSQYYYSRFIEDSAIYASVL